MKNKKIHISVKSIIFFFISLCILSLGINFYLQKNYKEAFAKNESHIEAGKSELVISKDGKYEYRINKEDNTIEIISYLKNNVEDLVIPENIDGMQVTSLGEASFAYHEELKSVTIPKTIKTIKMAVFGSCVNLQKAIFLQDVENIDDWAFGEFSGSIVTTKDSNLYRNAKDNGVKVEELK